MLLTQSDTTFHQQNYWKNCIFFVYIISEEIPKLSVYSKSAATVAELQLDAQI